MFFRRADLAVENPSPAAKACRVDQPVPKSPSLPLRLRHAIPIHFQLLSEILLHEISLWPAVVLPRSCTIRRKLRQVARVITFRRIRGQRRAAAVLVLAPAVADPPAADHRASEEKPPR